MPFAMNKNFSRARTDSQINMKNRIIRSTSSFIEAFQRRIISNIYQHMPIIIKNVANLCQILDDHPLTQTKIEQIQQGSKDCILWNEDQSHPIAIDQNNQLTELRQSIRELLHDFLEFTQQILIIYDKNDEIHFMIQKSMKYLFILNNYRTKRQSGYNYFCQNNASDDAMVILNNIDKQQFHQLRIIALHLRQFFIKLIKLISPKFSVLE
jgi:hypothetical protein